MADVVWGQGPSGFTVCDECEDGWVYPAPHGVDATDCPAFYDICRCEGTPCPSATKPEPRQDTLLHVLGNITKADGKEAPGE